MNRELLQRFLATRAIILPAALDGETTELAHIAPLAERIADSDVVALGEMNHFVHEKSDFRLLLARLLVTLGWTHFAEEIGWSDGFRIDRYLQSGDAAELSRLPSFGYTSHLRGDRDDRPGGILKLDNYPAKEFLWEQCRFYGGLRQEAGMLGRNIRLAGIDIDALPGGGYEDLDVLIPANSQSAEVVRHSLQRLPGETAESEAARLCRTLNLIPADWPDEISEAIQALSESLHYISLTYSATTYDEVRPGMAFRENAMKRRFLAARRLFADPKMIVMTHALHLAKNDAGIKAAGVGPGGNLVASLGHWLVQEQRQKVFSIWMLYGAGSDSQPLQNLPQSAKFPSHSLNRLLAGVTQPLLFFPADCPELFAEPCIIGHMYNALIEASLLEQVDAIMYFPQVSPLRGE